jgi:G:T-mismatch repair DNA endonuclease (very short patch repair protein)
MSKSTGTLQRLRKSEYVECFWHGCQCMPNRHKPIGNTEETSESVRGDTSEVTENRDAGYKVIMI